MHHFVDRRLNPPNKSLSNRRRFIARVRDAAKKAVDQAVRKRSITDVDRGEVVPIPARGVSEPSFRQARHGGRREYVLPGNKEYRPGDKLDKPPSGSSSGGGGSSGGSASPDGEGQDEFVFELTREEFLDLFFEDLELPDLIKRTLREIGQSKPARAGFSVAGTPANMSVKRTMSNALGRRIALKRPKDAELSALKERVFALERVSEPTDSQVGELKALHTEIEEMARRQRAVPYLDPLDVRYTHFVQRPEPTSSAVMFCLMDVSASMGEREKDLAKRFFVLLHLFLKRRYDRIDLVFIRHTHAASEVNEEDFFYSRETGGTVVSTALVEMKKVIADRYPPSLWNIYAAQASDGENLTGDAAVCAKLLQEDLMPLCQYFAYVEIVDTEEARLMASEATGMELWNAYRGVGSDWSNFAMKRVAQPDNIYPVFRELFSKRADAGR